MSVTLTVKSVGDPYQLSLLEDDVVLNPTLKAKLETEFKLLLVIEGTAANDWKKSMDPDKLYNYNLSYARALRLYNTWRGENIDLRKYNTEILICGSGLNGINRDTETEDNNKRFVIQIIPKIARPGNGK